MGALDGFYSTWNKARETFGQGTPDDGAQFDGSSRLLQMKAGVEAAAPDDRWQGSGSQAYAAANREHAAVYEKLADLDKKMAAEVKKASEVVTVGRSNLDTTKGWVDSMVSSLPATSAQDRESKLIPIAREGITRVDNIVKSSTDDMTTIKGNVDKLKGEYDTVTKQKFGPDGEKKDDVQMLGDEEAHALPPEEQAKRDVEDAMSEGDQGAAERIDNALTSIKPGETLSREQDAYLTAMQNYQKDMSVAELTAAKERLGDHKNIVADSWQLMSNDDVEYTGGAGEGDDKKGAASQLPDSVQTALKSAGVASIDEYTGEKDGLFYGRQLNDIAAIVKDGDPKFQTGTELDRQLIVAADKAMDTVQSGGLDDGAKSTVQGLFEAVDDDHQIINDHLMGRNGVDVDDFLKDVNTIDWEDNGKAAGYLFSWTNPGEDGFASDVERQLAAETADKYAEYIGSHRPQLLDIDGQTLGQLNPELVQRYAHGLVPFVDDMGGIGDSDSFKIDERDSRQDGLMPNAKGVFAVLNTDSVAANEINSAAYTEAMKNETAFALNPKDPEAQSHMHAAATMRGLVDVGAHEAFQAFQANGHEAGVDENKWKKGGFDAAVAALSTGGAFIPGVGVVAGPTISQVGSVFSNELFDNSPPPVDRPLQEMTTTRASHLILDAMLAAGNPLSLPEGWIDRSDPAHPHVVQPPGVNDDVYAATINAQIGEQTVVVNAKGPDEFYADRYNNVAQDPDIQQTPTQEEREEG